MTQIQEPSPQFVTEQRTYEWAPPGQGDLAALLAKDGFEQMLAVTQGELPPPPIGATVGMTDFVVERGAVTVTLKAQAWQYNPLGTVHGGVISTLLDTAAGCSVHTTLAVGESYTSLDLTVKFLRAVTVDSGTLRCVGKVVQRGRRTALAEAQLFDEQGRLVAHATSTCMIFS